MKYEPAQVGIGLPLYNNERHLRTLLDSIRSQSYADWVVYISDDCSSDATADICKSYTERDSRFRYFRNARNIGANANNKKTLELAETPYFMFSRGHERLSENLVAACMKELLKGDDVVLAYATTVWIDDHDKEIPGLPIGYFDTRGFDVVSRCALALWGNWDAYYGISKTSLLRSIRANEDYVGNDLINVFEKALRGGFAHVPGAKRYRRHRYRNETYAMRMKRYLATSHKHATGLNRLFPLARLPVNLLRSVLRAPVSRSEKLKIIAVVLANAPLRYLNSRGKGVGQG